MTLKFDREFANNGVSTLTAAITASDDRISVADASVFPVPPFLITIETEICEVITVVGNEFQDVSRGLQGTAAVPHAQDVQVFNNLTAGDMEELRDRVNRLAGGNFIYAGTLYFTESGTFTKAEYPELTAIAVEVVGGGGSGGGCEATAAGERAESGGAGGGGYSKKDILVDELEDIETITVGKGAAGATAGLAGNDGETSSFGIHLSAEGGKGGALGNATSNISAASGGNGGVPTGGDLNIPGGEGGNGRVIGGTFARANFGGGAHLAPSVVSIGTTTPGRAGRGYGGGSSGSRNFATQDAQSSVEGADGIVIVTLYV